MLCALCWERPYFTARKALNQLAQLLACALQGADDGVCSAASREQGVKPELGAPAEQQHHPSVLLAPLEHDWRPCDLS